MSVYASKEVAEHESDVHQLMETKYTRLVSESEVLIHSIRSDLTPALGMSLGLLPSVKTLTA